MSAETLTQILGKIQKGSKGTTRAGVGSTRGLKEIIDTQGKASAGTAGYRIAMDRAGGWRKAGG